MRRSWLASRAGLPALLGALLTAGCSGESREDASLGAASARCPAPALPDERLAADPLHAAFVDGARRVGALRLAPRRVHSDVGALSPIVLEYEDRGLTVGAEVDATALVEVDGADDAAAADALRAEGLSPIRPVMSSIGLWLVRGGDGEDGLDVASRLAARVGGGRIRQAVPNLYLRHELRGAPFTPNDPRYPGQWYFDNLDMGDAWALSKGSSKTTVVVVDTGCDMQHPDLVAKLDPGKDVVDGDDDPTPTPMEDGNAHGTACAGLVGAATDNGSGIAGACPDCRLRCVRLLAGTATVPISADVDAFAFAKTTGAAVVSNSWGFTDPIPVPQTLADAINDVFDNGRGGLGALVIFAAGNADHQIAPDELEAVRGVFAVGAITNQNEKTSFTNYGDAIDVVAPTGTLSTDISGPDGFDPSDYTNSFGGTSSACPVVAGIAGLLVSAAPDKKASELYDVMIKTTRPAPQAIPDANGHDPVYGYGIIDPVAALDDVLGIATPDGGTSAKSTARNDESGGCSAATPPPARSPWWLGAAALLVARRRRRR